MSPLPASCHQTARIFQKGRPPRRTNRKLNNCFICHPPTTVEGIQTFLLVRENESLLESISNGNSCRRDKGESHHEISFLIAPAAFSSLFNFFQLATGSSSDAESTHLLFLFIHSASLLSHDLCLITLRCQACTVSN